MAAMGAQYVSFRKGTRLAVQYVKAATKPAVAP
jgi:hypothetical protein